MRLGVPDATGPQAPQVIEDSSYVLDCDMAITALGLDPDDLPALFGAPDLTVSRWGTVRLDYRSMMTALDGAFAARDIVRAASLVVLAVRAGLAAPDPTHSSIAHRDAQPASEQAGLPHPRPPPPDPPP